MADLSFQRARIDDLPERSIRGQRQQITRNVKSACAQRPFVGFGFHVRGTRRDAGEILEGLLRALLVAREQGPNRLVIEGARRCARKAAAGARNLEVRRVVSALLEVLVTRRPLLAVPALLVDNDD